MAITRFVPMSLPTPTPPAAERAGGLPGRGSTGGCSVRARALALAFSFALSSAAAGCTLIGAGIGAAADSGRRPIEPERLAGVEIGTKVAVVFQDGSRQDGVYGGRVRVPEERYRAAYAAWRAELGRGVWLPMPNDPVSLTDSQGRDWDYRFLGFEPGAVSVRSAQQPAELNVRLDRVRSIRGSQGELLEGDALRTLFLRHRPPMRSELRLETESGTEQIAWDRIARIEERRTRRGWLIGGLVGLGIDVALLTLVATDDVINLSIY